MNEQVLPGGAVNRVVRAGDTVRRSTGSAYYGDRRFVHDLLVFFEQAGWTGAPRFLGVDEAGREILTYIDGESGDGLAGLGELTRHFHDLTADTALAAGAEVVCHNDLSPGNTVYSGGRAIAFVDWDLAAPGRRIHDVAHLCWQFTCLREVEPTLAGMRAICEGYDLADRSELIAAVLWWQERCRTGIERAARAGDPAMLRLQERRAVDEIHAAEQWVRAHRKRLEEGLRH